MKEKKLKLPKLADKKHRSKAFNEPGLFWHYHHATLVESSSNASERIEEICYCKPKEEHFLRFKLFNRVKQSGLPKEAKELLADYIKKWRKWKRQGNGRSYQAFDLSRSALHRWLYANLVLMEKLHKKQCKGCTWDDRTIFTGKYAHLDP